MRQPSLVLLISCLVASAVAQRYNRPPPPPPPHPEPHRRHAPPAPPAYRVAPEHRPYPASPAPPPYAPVPAHDPAHDPAPQLKPEGCIPCCTTGFPKRHHPGYGYSASFGVAPLENVELFPPGVCPHKTPEILCEAASERFAVKGTKYIPKLDHLPYSEPKKPHYPPHEGYLPPHDPHDPYAPQPEGYAPPPPQHAPKRAHDGYPPKPS
eukprot:Selendium_serpulae@DN1329_c0_g1_i1.p1